MSKLTRIIIHWTAGELLPNNEDIEHYHYLIDGTGKLHNGKYKPEDNLNCQDDKYAAHTGGMNTGSIGVATCGMFEFHSAKSPGKQLLTKSQIEKLCSFIASLSLKYNIPIKDIMTHYEVGQKVLKGEIEKNDLTKKNIGKIDITYLPYEPKLRPDEIGDYLRTKVAWYYSRLKGE